MKKPWARWRWALGGWLARLRLWQPGKLMYIGGSDVLPAPLNREEESQLIQRLAQGDQSASGPLIEHNLRLVVYIARRFENTGINIEDLISIGTIGLIKAVGTYQPAKKIKLATYASRCIENEILMLLRAGKKYSREVSLFEPIGLDKDGEAISLVDVVQAENKDFLEEIILDQDVRELYEAFETCLSEQEKTVISMRYGLLGKRAWTQREIAKHLGISRSYVSRRRRC